jgi:hypothetical protein
MLLASACFSGPEESGLLQRRDPISRIRKRLPSPAMIVAIVALTAASAGTSFAAIGLSGLSKSAKDKTVGVGKQSQPRGLACCRPLGVSYVAASRPKR